MKIGVNGIESVTDRQYGGDGEIGILAESMKAVGLINAIQVARSGEGYKILAGRRRLAAARLLGWTEIEAEVLDEQQAEHWEAISLAENVNRKEMHPLDEGLLFMTLLGKGKDVKVIAKYYDRSVSGIYQRIKLNDLLEDIKVMFRDGRLELTSASMLASLTEKQQSQFVKKYGGKEEGVGLWQVREFVHGSQHNVLKLMTDKKCSRCRERTNYTDKDLFPELGEMDDVCFNDECYAKHWTAWLEDQLARAGEKYPKKKVRNALVFQHIPKFYGKAKTLELAGETWEIKPGGYEHECYGKEKGAYQVWKVSGYNARDGLHLEPGWYKEAEEKKEAAAAKPLSRFDLDKVLADEPEDYYREADKALETRYSGPWRFENTLNEKVLDKCLQYQAEHVTDTGTLRRILFKDRSWTGTIKRYYRLLTGTEWSKDLSGLESLPENKLLSLLVAEYRGNLHFNSPSYFKDKQFVSQTMLEFTGITEEQFKDFYRDTLAELVKDAAENPAPVAADDVDDDEDDDDDEFEDGDFEDEDFEDGDEGKKDDFDDEDLDDEDDIPGVPGEDSALDISTGDDDPF